MRYSIGHIHRKPGLDRAAFRHHYESRHTALARRILPRFSHYIRNHVVACTAPEAPDCISEFGIDSDQTLREIGAILGDARGRPLLEDELLFMDKTRNAPFRVERRELAAPLAGGAHKYVVALDGAAPALPARLGELRPATLCAANTGECAWLLGWSERRLAPEALRSRLREAGLAVRWCAAVEEARGYPDVS